MASTHKKPLMLAYGYPPTYAGWTERSVKFVKYLPEYGWTPVVVTRAAGGKEARVGTERVLRVPDVLVAVRERIRTKPTDGRAESGDDTHGAMPFHRRLKRAVFKQADKWLAIPDWTVGWAASAFVPALRALREEEADVIYSTSPPASAHLLGLALKKATGKPWVMDYRDPWTFESLNVHLRRPGFRLSVERRLERLCLAHADAVVANTPRAKRRFGEQYPDFGGKLRVITNGFDGGELARAAACLDHPAPWRSFDAGTFVISHAGDFFRFGQGGDRTPHSLLDAMKNLLDEGAISPETCRFVFAGKLPPVTVRRIRELGLTDLVDAVGVISHFDATRLMLMSDLLLLFDPKGDGETYVRSKLYEYIGSGKPILGVVPDGAHRELLEKSGRGLLASPDDPESIKRAVERAIEHRGAHTTNPDFDQTNYDRKKIAGELATLLDELVGAK